MAEPDLSKIVSMIMNNPTLVEEIRDMVAKSDAEEEEKNEEGENEVIASAHKKAAARAKAGHIIPHKPHRRGAVLNEIGISCVGIHAVFHRRRSHPRLRQSVSKRLRRLAASRRQPPAVEIDQQIKHLPLGQMQINI